MPGWSSSGNIRPASSKIMSPLHSKAVMFLPMASRPPSGMILSFAFGSLPAFEPRRGFRPPEGASLAAAVSPRESCGRLRSRFTRLKEVLFLRRSLLRRLAFLPLPPSVQPFCFSWFSLVIQCLFLKVVTRKNADPRASGRRRIFNGGRF